MGIKRNLPTHTNDNGNDKGHELKIKKMKNTKRNCVSFLQNNQTQEKNLIINKFNLLNVPKLKCDDVDTEVTSFFDQRS